MYQGQGNIYYVAPDGNDESNGSTLITPFRTISQAAKVMQAGDTCYIRAGIYRETVKPAYSGLEAAPIRFEKYCGEKVVLSGCEPIAGWSLHSGSIYQGEMTWNMENGNGNMVFVNGELYTEAQWPNITDRLDRSQYAVVDHATHEQAMSTIYDEDLLAFPDGYWDGAIVACVNGVGYFISTAIVTHSASGTLYHEPWVSSAGAYQTQPGDIYFITRTGNALNNEKAWYYDPHEQKLSLWAAGGGNPELCEVEAKSREYAFDLRGLAYVELIGMECRAASITMENAHHCLVAQCSFIGLDRYFGSRQSIYGKTKGLELGGHDNVLRDSEIAYFEGIGVNVMGYRNKVVNCYIHDGNLETSYASLVWITGSEHLISNSTITRAGRTCVSGVFAKSVIQYCDISFANCLVKDSGIIYLFNHDFDNTEIHHNWLHDNLSNHLSFGFYMDAWTSGVNFFRNVVWNVPHHGLHLNRPIQRTLVYNNSFYASGDAHSSVFCFDDMSGMQVVNNIFAEGVISDWGDDCFMSNNLIGVDAGFISPQTGDFRLSEYSAAIDAGRVIAGVTDGFKQGAPDQGAYEYGGEYWIPGHDFAVCVEVELNATNLTCKSKLGNCGFESGAWDPWYVAEGNPRIAFECAWDYSWYGYQSIVRSNKYAAVLGKGDRIEQKVTGLSPNTTYTFWMGSRTGELYQTADQFDHSHSEGDWDLTPEGKHALYRDTPYVGPLQEGDWLQFSNVDFGDRGQYNHLSLGLTKITGPVMLEARLDSLEGELLCRLTVADDYNSVWKYFQTTIRAAGGKHHLFLILKGTGKCLLQSFKLGHSFTVSPVRLSVQGYGNKAEGAVSRIIRRLNWDTRPEEITFTTGPDGREATVSIENEGKYYVYVDDCGLWNPQL